MSWRGKLIIAPAMGCCALVAAEMAVAQNGRAGSLYIRGDMNALFVTPWQDSVTSEVVQFPGNPTTTAINGKAQTDLRFGGGIGAYLTDAVRAEITSGYWRHNYSANFVQPGNQGHISAPVRNVATYVSGYLDLPAALSMNLGPFVPYVGGGFGFAWTRVGRGIVEQTATPAIISDESRNVSYAWQVSGGSEIVVTNRLSLDVGYTYSDMGRFRFGRTLHLNQFGIDILLTDPLQTRIRAHSVNMGLRFRFSL